MEASESGTVAVLAEKPSVARDIARILGATKQGEGYLQGNGYVVTWAIGHLVALGQPHDMNPEWRRWRSDLLPMLPERWPLTVYDKTKDQFEVVRRIITSQRVSRLVCATDAGREGELIFRYIYEAADCEKPFQRLWISSLTPDAIRRGFETLRPGSEYDPLADAATGRSRADWLVGMNLSRAYSLAYGEELSVGRVQTPTLAMIVERDLAIRDFVPENYIEVVATFHPTGTPKANTYTGTWFRSKSNASADGPNLQAAMRLPPDGEEARTITSRAKTGIAHIETVTFEDQRTAPPLLYDLTELQRHANRLFGFSAQRTLDLAQALYETYKLISYPRTDSRHLSNDVAATLPGIVRAIAAPYREHLAPGTGERPLSKRFVDDTKVSDHHAIIPTVVSVDKAAPPPDERKIYDLVCRRLLSAWHDDLILAVTTVVMAIANPGFLDRYHTSGTAVRQGGWKALDPAPAPKKTARGKNMETPDDSVLPSDLAKGQQQDVVSSEAQAKKTRPPKRLTEATLLTAMETAGKTLDEKELSQAMRESGLGTPATRAGIIEVLLKREYITRDGKTLNATPKGIHLIEVVHPEVKSPAMTGQWEAYLQRIQKGASRLPHFMEGIEEYVRKVVNKVSDAPPINSARPTPISTAPVAAAGTSLEQILSEAFGFDSFRPNQEAVCRATVAGQDVLLVMPTGSGKSLCYQLPGLARGGTTLVISPLIALMDDQAAKLKERGFAVDCIHSGRDREASRQACRSYLGGHLQFLFIAPERLRVTGFAEMLAKRKPSLIAIDEAHCISQWGHDFRPDYRTLGHYLPALRPAPVIALTATATPIVQKDIAEQIGLQTPSLFIHGFRRDNIAIEVVEIKPGGRIALAREILQEPGRQPAIIYVPTRKQAEAVASELHSHCKVASYHAGLDARHRTKVQEDFLAGRLDVMVATIAFGMGIDKPDVRTVIHTALPGSLEGYYQEIGRAGRDGKPSRAVLMHSYADRYTHDFFFERDYPDVAILDRIYARLTAESTPKATVQRGLRIDPDIFDKALEKLWTNGGALVDFEENITRGDEGWRPLYLAHGKQKGAGVELMIRYAEGFDCRMSSLVRHFGDATDAQSGCGICDACAPSASVAQQFRAATVNEQVLLGRILGHLAESQTRSTGRLYADLCPAGELTRDAFEELLGAMARAGLLTHADASFEKDGKVIPYRTVTLTDAAFKIIDPQEVELAIRSTEPAAKQATRRSKSKKAAAQPVARATNRTVDDKLEAGLRAWRLAEAKKRGIPAFRIFSDQVLRAIASEQPTSDREFLTIPGIGLATVQKYGKQLYSLIDSL